MSNSSQTGITALNQPTLPTAITPDTPPEEVLRLATQQTLYGAMMLEMALSQMADNGEPAQEQLLAVSSHAQILVEQVQNLFDQVN